MWVSSFPDGRIDWKVQELANLVIKLRKLNVLLVAIAVLWVVSMLLPFQGTVRAMEVITDNFNDMDYTGWDTYGMVGNYTTTPSTTSLAGAGNFSAADQTLKVTGPLGNMPYGYWSNAYIDSAVSFGMWSFDLYVVNVSRGYAWVTLWADHYYPREAWGAGTSSYMNESYEIWVYTRDLSSVSGLSYFDRPMITLERVHSGFATLRGEYAVGSPSDTWTNCWTHFDVTRNATGHIQVYVNGTLRISTLDYTDSITGYFMFTGQSGYAIDSVVISGYAEVPDIPDVLPPPDFTLPLIAISAIELIVIIVLVILYFRRRP